MTACGGSRRAEGERSYETHWQMNPVSRAVFDRCSAAAEADEERVLLGLRTVEGVEAGALTRLGLDGGVDGLVEDEMDLRGIAQDDVLADGFLEFRAAALEDGQHAVLLGGLAADGNEDAAAAQVHRRERVRERDGGGIEIRPVHDAVELDAQFAADEFVDARDSVGFHKEGG